MKVMMDFAKRLNKLRVEFIAKSDYQVLLIEDPVHLFYLTGLDLSLGKILITKDLAVLVVDGRYYESCLRMDLYTVILASSFSFKSWIVTSQIFRLAFEKERATYQQYSALQDLSDALNDENYDLILEPIESPLQKMRLIKDDEEIRLIRQACDLCYKGYEYVVSKLKEGVTEAQIACELEIFWKLRGGNKVSFDPIIAFGQNSSKPHYRAGDAVLQSGMPVLIDIGVELDHYHSDMTRVVFFGESKPEMKKIYHIVEQAKQKALNCSVVGVPVGKLDFEARSYIEYEGYGPFFMHSLGHGVGLEVHEIPTIRHKNSCSGMFLEPGMVITIEPGIYLPGVGGVRLEDTILITDVGYEILTK